MVVLPFFVLAHFEDDRVKLVIHPSDGAKLFWIINALIDVIRPVEYLLNLFKPMPRRGFARSLLLFLLSKWKRIV